MIDRYCLQFFKIDIKDLMKIIMFDIIFILLFYLVRILMCRFGYWHDPMSVSHDPM